MKKAFGKILAAVLFAGALVFAGCSNDSSDDSSGASGLSVKDVSGWTDLQDSDWSAGTWSYSAQTINNANDPDDLDTYKATGTLVIEGTESSSKVTIKDLEGDTVEDINTGEPIKFSKFVEYVNTNYDEDALKESVSQLVSTYGITIKSKSIKAYKKINSQKDQIELFKSLILTGSDGSETRTLIAQLNESFVKQ